MLLAIVMVISGILTGCTNQEGETSGGQSNEQNEEAVKESSVEIDYFTSMRDEVTNQIIKDAIAKYESDTGNKVNLSIMEEEAYKTKIKTNMASNSLPDVFDYWTGETFNTLVLSENVKDITDLVNADPEYKDLFIGGAFDSLTIDNKVYGVPTGVGGQILFYNKQIFKDAGIESVPTTYDELLSICEKIKAEGVVPIVVGSKDRWPLLGWFSYLAVREGGTELYKEVTDGSSDKTFTEDAFVVAGERLRYLADNYFINGSLAIKAESAAAQFATGQAAMFVGGTWDIALFKDNEETIDDIGFCSFPVVENGVEKEATTVYGGVGNCVAISNSSEVSEEAYELIQYLYSVENSEKLIKEIGALSVLKIDVKEDEMLPISYEITEFFNNEVTGFFPYTDQALKPEQAENLLDAMSAIVVGGETDVEKELSKIK